MNQSPKKKRAMHELTVCKLNHTGERSRGADGGCRCGSEPRVKRFIVLVCCGVGGGGGGGGGGRGGGGSVQALAHGSGWGGDRAPIGRQQRWRCSCHPERERISSKMRLNPLFVRQCLSLSLSLLCVDLTLCSASCSLCSQRGRGEVHGVIISPWASGLDQHTRRVFAFGSEEPRDRKANSEEKVPPFDFLEGTVNRIWCGKYGGTTVTQNTDCFSQKVSI